MSAVTSYEPGTPSFIDLATTDLDAAKAFYTDLFGWDAADMPMPQGGIYSMLSKGGKDVAGAYVLNAEMAAMDVPPHWVSYVTVADADAAAFAVASAGGTVIAEPFDVMTAGRMAVAADPGGATFSMWQPRESIGSYLVNEPGSLVWNELQTSDTEAAAAFYGAVFGWGTETTEMPTGTYTSFTVGDRGVAGMMEIRPEWGPVRPNWSIYLGVEDVDASMAKAIALGGKALMEPMEVPNAGRFTMLSDSQGAMFYIMGVPPGDG
ncbi:MAG: VOC family protein [Acidimicrobiia bacterium]